VTALVADPIEALLESAEMLASLRNDEVIFGLLDRIDHPSGPLWDLIRELHFTCEYRYVERKIRRKERYLQDWLDAREHLYANACSYRVWDGDSPAEIESASGPPTIRDFLRAYKQRIVGLSPCGKCRICVREKLFPGPNTHNGFTTTPSRRLRDRQLARAMAEERDRNFAGLLSEICR